MNKPIGSPDFVAPEIYESSYTIKCDLWSLGVMLYIALICEYPFSED